MVRSSFMETPQVKSEIVQAIQGLAEDATVEDHGATLLFREIGRVFREIGRGLKESESDTLSHEEIKARFLK